MGCSLFQLSRASYYSLNLGRVGALTSFCRVPTSKRTAKGAGLLNRKAGDIDVDLVSDPEVRWGPCMVAQMLRKKSFVAFVDALSHNKLHCTLDFTALVSMNIGAVLGAGVLVIPGQAASLYAGPALSLPFL
ncbi:hypothetical protein GH5_02901 [Leishmania sp. Ghana 2012 LV757]|uniref:hypothetical protein n=1 Tax=Leishmania sp. Ghana 2012 LV757 TaxID=2803181 RepID=UPI001B4B8875|nr:hypothetical protein GH5_02901 [Leishmania sp. Ghana 2012 LV757]